MPLRPYLFRKVTIIGVGLIGGSVGLAIKKHRLAREVVGLSQQDASLQAAKKMGAIDQGCQDVKQSVNNTDLVILATPVSIISGMLTMIAPHLKRGCIVTDVGSTKLSIVNVAESKLNGNAFFVGSHPLAGSEKKGVQHASADLFEKCICIMTPTQKTNNSACDRVKKLWIRLGAKVKYMAPEEHDEVLAYVSHLPHVLAYMMMEVIPPQHLEYSAAGLKDSTRIASSSPQLWNDICMGNSKNIMKAIDEIVYRLSLVRKSLINQDSQALTAQFLAAKEKRDKLE